MHGAAVLEHFSPARMNCFLSLHASSSNSDRKRKDGGDGGAEAKERESSQEKNAAEKQGCQSWCVNSQVDQKCLLPSNFG